MKAQNVSRSSPVFRNRAARSVRRITLRGNPPHRPQHDPLRHGDGPIFKAGDSVPETGIYEVIHDRAHRTPHEVVMVPHSEGTFPTCETCKAKVRYKLVRTAPYIFNDDDFKEPVG